MPKRRANGEGNIRKRKDGRWEGRYTAGYDPESGKRIIKNVLGKTQAEVKEKLKTAISESQRLDVSKAGTYTVASWVRTWYEVYAEPRIRPNTKAYYTNYIENHIIPGIGSIPLDKLTTIQIQRFYNNLQKSGRVQRKNFPELRDKSLSPRVVRGVHTLLHNCLEQAVAERLILTNPAQGCKLPQLEKREMKILPQEKIGMYLAEAEKRGLLAAFYLELTTGLRRGELLALQWTDLDIENRTLAVTKQVNRINGELVVGPPKTRNSVRTLALPQQAVDLLIAEHKKHPRNPYLFPSPKTGTMYDPDAFRRTHDKILKAIGAEHIRFHDLRHTFATLSLKSGGGRENAVRRAGPLLGGVHPEHLYSRHGPDETGRCRYHRRGHQPADAVSAAKKYRARQDFSCLALSGTFRAFPRVGQRVSLDETPKIKQLKKLQITKENHRNQAISVIFGGDYWTRTSGLMRVKIR